MNGLVFFILKKLSISAQPIGQFIGGQILGNGDQDTHNQLYNYIPVFIVSLCAQLGGIVWILLVIHEDPPQRPRVSLKKAKLVEKVTLSKSSTMEAMDENVIRSGEEEEAEISNIFGAEDAMSHSPDISFYSVRSISTYIFYPSRKFIDMFRGLFKVSNIKDLWLTMTRHRPHKGRGQIWFLFTSFAFIMFAYMNTVFVLWPYVEKLYSWSPKYYSSVTSALAVTSLFTIGLILLVFLKSLKFLNDLHLALIGIISLMAQCMLRGSWQHEPGLYLSFLAGSVASLSFIGIRSRLSKIINDDESGKLFALLAIVESIIPGIASVYYSIVFSKTMDVYPGLVFQIAAFLMLVPMFCVIFMDILCVHDYDAGARSSEHTNSPSSLVANQEGAVASTSAIQQNDFITSAQSSHYIVNKAGGSGDGGMREDRNSPSIEQILF